jgi:hypothetical protein
MSKMTFGGESVFDGECLLGMMSSFPVSQLIGHSSRGRHPRSLPITREDRQLLFALAALRQADGFFLSI